jgi:hypothetical protein
MGTLELPQDLREFLRLLNSHAVEYLLVGGYAVGFYGNPRTTGDMDIWVGISASNAAKLADVFIEFGYSPKNHLVRGVSGSSQGHQNWRSADLYRFHHDHLRRRFCIVLRSKESATLLWGRGGHHQPRRPQSQ